MYKILLSSSLKKNLNNSNNNINKLQKSRGENTFVIF
jgi:hypothetical protein